MSTADFPSDWSLYPYNPNKPLPIIFAVIVFSIGAYHYLQTIHRYRWPRFGWLMIWASTVWLAGFITRSYSVFHTQNVPLYICQYVFILAGPPIFAAAETFILGRLYAYMPYNASLHPGRVLSTFFLLGTAVEVLAANGASRLAGTGSDSTRASGYTLLNVSLVIQAVLEVLFFTLVGLFHYKCTRKGNHFPHHVKTMCYLLYVTSSMMFVRCCVRIAEGFEHGTCKPDPSNPLGYCGTVSRNEWFLWVFEVANIALFVLALAIFTPGKYLSQDDHRFLDQNDGVTERQGPGFAQIDKRPWLITVVDPFNFAAIIRGKEPFPHFWEEEWPVAEGGNYAVGKDRMELRRAGKIDTKADRTRVGEDGNAYKGYSSVDEQV